MNSRHMLAFVVLSILACASCTGCSGALNGGTWNVGHEDNRVAGAKLYDQHCGGCHDPKAGTDAWHAKTRIAPVLKNVPAPDLLSSTWREKLLFEGREADPATWPSRPMQAAFMHTLFSNVCWYGRERWPNGDRVIYGAVNRTTLDGLPIPVPVTSGHHGERPVVVMPPCGLDDTELDAIRDWITCTQYPGTSACKGQQ